MKSSVTTAAWVAMAAVASFQGLSLALIFLRPDLDPAWHAISEWVIGPYGGLMRLAFFLSALSYAALYVAMRPLVRGRLGRIGLRLLLICVVGTIGVGVFAMDPLTPPVQVTPTGVLHTVLGSVALLLLPFAALCINLSLAYQNKTWWPARPVLLWAAGMPLLGFLGSVVYIVGFVAPLPIDYGPGVNIGWPSRVTFFTYAIWLITVAWQTIKKQRARDVGMAPLASTYSRGGGP